MNQNIMINQHNENGFRHGLWKNYYALNPGQLMFIGIYDNGGQHGLWEWYRYDGLTNLKGNIKKNRRTGLWYEKEYD